MADDIDYRPFDGDGRLKIEPKFTLPATLPMTLSKSRCRMTIRNLVESGVTNHSGQGGTLWVVLAWCQFHEKPYELTAYPGKAYMVKLIQNPIPL